MKQSLFALIVIFSKLLLFLLNISDVFPLKDQSTVLDVYMLWFTYHLPPTLQLVCLYTQYINTIVMS